MKDERITMPMCCGQMFVMSDVVWC